MFNFQSNPQPRFLQLWFSNPQFDRSTIAEVSLLDQNGQKIPLGAHGNAGVGAEGPSEWNGNLGWIRETFSPDFGSQPPAEVTVRLCYTIGPLQNTQELEVQPKTRMSMALEGDSLLNGIGQTLDGIAFVSMVVNKAKLKSRQFGVVAVTKDGNQLNTSAKSDDSIGNGNGVRTETFEFNKPLAEVTKFIIGTRQIRTNEWKNVNLPNG